MRPGSRYLPAAALAALVLCFAAPAWAKPRIEISISQAREVVEVKDGARTVTVVPTQTASPGDVIQYTLTYRNTGDELARDAAIDDAIPKGTTFVAGSATGEGAQIVFSIDGGKSFAPAERLYVEVRLPSGELEKRPAPPGEYTHVRWIIKQVAPGATGSVTFRVRVS
jgi:uncharacterized repeat protein (TIGR01451 family)